MNTQTNNHSTSSQAQTIALEGKEVRERISQLVLDVLGAKKDLKATASTIREILEGAAKGVVNAGKDKQGEVLKEVLDGIGTGLGKTAQAAKLTLEEAAGKGETFASEDVSNLVSDLSTLEEMFVETTNSFVKDTATNAWKELADIKDHILRVAKDMKSPVEDAIEAAKKSPLKLSSDAAKTGVSMARQATGSLFEAFAGVMSGLGQAITPTSEDEKE